jgi:hypothetical protein
MKSRFDLQVEIKLAEYPVVYGNSQFQGISLFPPGKLMACLRIADRSVLKLIWMWLKASVVEPSTGGKGGRSSGSKGHRHRGTPQGGVISPLLANIYLHWFDKVFHQPGSPACWANARLVRYANDLVWHAAKEPPRENPVTDAC